MKKNIILIVSLIGTLALTGCDQSVGVTGGCVGSNSISPQCDISGAYRATWKSTYSNFDASLASLDLSQSNVDLIGNTGNIVLTIKNGSKTTIATSVFSWYRSGDIVYPSDTIAMSDFVNAYLQDGNEIHFDVQGMTSTANTGSNNFVALFRYGSNSIGASDGFFLNGADLNNF